MLLSACSSLEAALPAEGPVSPVTTEGHELATTETTSVANPAEDPTTTEVGDDTDPVVTTTTEPGGPVDIPAYAGQLNVVVVASYPHDPGAYTEGLGFYNGMLIEATGLYGSSTRRQVDPASGSVSLSVDLQPEHWGSGLAITGDTGVQVTRHEQVAIVFDPETLREFTRFELGTSAWGVCATDEVFFVSTNNNTLSVRDPMSFSELSTIAVTDNGAATPQLGELECVGDHIWATIWPTNRLVQINADGVVTATADLTSIVPEDDVSPENTLGGIAYNESTGTFFVTGKRWGTTYEITFTEAG